MVLNFNDLGISYSYLQAGHLQSRYWGGSDMKTQDPKSEQVGWRDAHEMFWIDVERFNVLFTSIAPWGVGDIGPSLGTRCFRVCKTCHQKQSCLVS